jgi:predicted transcriptional regulator
MNDMLYDPKLFSMGRAQAAELVRIMKEDVTQRGASIGAIAKSARISRKRIAKIWQGSQPTSNELRRLAKACALHRIGT